jgi:membrane-associated PAP2 superfamily phosphatase
MPFRYGSGKPARAAAWMPMSQSSKPNLPLLSPAAKSPPVPGRWRPANGLRSGLGANLGKFGVVPQAHDWMTWQLTLPLLAFVLASVLLMAFGGDFWLADHLYAWEGGRWALRDSFVTTTVIHEIGKRITVVAWLGVVAATVVAQRKPALRAWHRPLLCLALSVMAATLAVSMMKHLTHMDCPWDLQAYGGTHSYFGLFSFRPANVPASGCFPAGQASAGYAWVALYFFFLAVRPAWRWWGLGIGIAAGLLFGISQQLRGAHFLSHDLWTLMACWLISLLLYRWLACGGFQRRTPGPARFHEPDPH